MPNKHIAKFYQNILNSLPEGIIFIDQKQFSVTYMNECAKKILNYSPIFESNLKHLTFEQILSGPTSRNSTQASQQFFSEHKNEAKQNQMKTEEMGYFYNFTGEKIKIAYQLIREAPYGESGYTIQFKEFEKSELMLQLLSYYDQLTFLPNRLYAEQFFSNVIEKYQKIEKQISILFMDLDGFKAVNDTNGHKTGDELLKEISKRVQNQIGEKGIVSRFGGDEFIIILEDYDNTNELIQFSNQLLSLISQPMSIQGFNIKVSASIGAACYPHDGLEMQTLIKKADEAMYVAKKNGKNAIYFYNQHALPQLANIEDSKCQKNQIES